LSPGTHGPGGNGKGVFISTISWVMGEYAIAAAMDTFTASNGDKHPTDLAMLRGARMVMVSETEEGRAWAESRMKSLTGGDKIQARFMRQDFFEYMPQFKLTIIGNHKPILKNVDDAAKRRINMVPFLFKPPVVDFKLDKKLQEEGPGILRWMIEGCLDWQKNGLIRPPVVINATAEYFSEQDTLSAWIEDCCKSVGYGGTESSALFANWQKWTLKAGEEPGSQKRFSQALEAKGYAKDPKARHATFLGIALEIQASRTENPDDRE
jgi:putative DNA primase/helicase